MTASLALYHVGTRLLEPAIPLLLERRLKAGKERTERVGERLGLTKATRPGGVVVWLHAASVGESRLLLDLFAELRQRRPDLNAVITTHTLTSADMIAAAAPAGVTHQMAPLDAPGTVKRFLAQWKPDAAVFAEGEIWPNMLGELIARNIPAALVNARMTKETVSTWKNLQGAAKRLFAAFGFIGAADEATAMGLMEAIERPIEVVGNLKRSTAIAVPDANAVTAWRQEAGARPILLAASTHPGEDEFALDAFSEVRMRALGALLIIVPRHPDRGPAIAELSRGRGLTTQVRSEDRSTPSPPVDVLVADTMGELLFWYAASDGIYLAGATAEGVGGHNAIEPAQLGKRVFTGPHGFNFRDTFAELQKAGALTIGTTHQELADYWLAALNGDAQQPEALGAFFAEAKGPFEGTMQALLAMIPRARDA